MTEAMIGMITGIAALISIGVFIYKRGQKDGELTSTVEMLKEIVPQMLNVQKGLSAVCQQISEHECDLDRGSKRFDLIREEVADIKERLAAVETKVEMMHPKS